MCCSLAGLPVVRLYYYRTKQEPKVERNNDECVAEAEQMDSTEKENVVRDDEEASLGGGRQLLTKYQDSYMLCVAYF